MRPVRTAARRAAVSSGRVPGPAHGHTRGECSPTVMVVGTSGGLVDEYHAAASGGRRGRVVVDGERLATWRHNDVATALPVVGGWAAPDPPYPPGPRDGLA